MREADSVGEANPVGEGKISTTVAVDIIPSPTRLAGNLNPKVSSLC